MNLTISGASGLIGRRLLKTLAGAGHSLHVLSRHAGTNLPPGVKLAAWNPVAGEPPAAALADADAVIHLAGEPVAQRWTEEAKRRIRESRVAGTRNLVAAMAKLPQPPRALICASAVGYYGSRGDDVLTEDCPPGSDFLAGVCVEWEHAAQAAEAFGVRVARVRIGVVLDPRGGALAKMLPAFKLGAGGRIAGGRQWMSWIHAADLASLFQLLAENPLAGAFNAVAPNPVSNEEFTRALAGALHRPALFPVPSFALKVMFGEMSEVLLGSQRALPKAAEAAGLRFHFPEIGPALEDALRQ